MRTVEAGTAEAENAGNATLEEAGAASRMWCVNADWMSQEWLMKGLSC